MRTLFVYQFLTLGGVESVVQSRIDALGDFGIDADAWFMSEEGGAGTFAGLQDRLHFGGVGALSMFVEASSPDLIISIDTPTALHLLRNGSVGPLIVLECHTTYPENLDYLSLVDSNEVCAVFVPSEHQRRIVHEHLRMRIPVKVVPNPVGRAFFRESPPPREIPATPVVAWVGRLDSLKNWEAFLNLAGHLEKSGQEFQYWVIGDTSDRGIASRFFRVAKEMRILPQLRWFRQVPHARMPGLHTMIRMSGGMVASTSENESFGLAIAEAMASGIAVLAPRLGPFPELITDNVTGYLYDPGDIPGAAEKATAVLRDRSLRLQTGDSARQNVLARFSPEVALGSLANTIRSVASSAISPRL